MSEQSIRRSELTIVHRTCKARCIVFISLKLRTTFGFKSRCHVIVVYQCIENNERVNLIFRFSTGQEQLLTQEFQLALWTSSLTFLLIQSVDTFPGQLTSQNQLAQEPRQVKVFICLVKKYFAGHLLPFSSYCEQQTFFLVVTRLNHSSLSRQIVAFQSAKMSNFDSSASIEGD